MAVYQKGDYHFKFVVVAQGKTEEEYFNCYQQLKGMGFEHIAIGGLLQKVAGTVRYTQVRDEDFMFSVLRKIREQHPQDWLFALGCFHPSRQKQFSELGVWGDYKGWIFQYKKRDEALTPELIKLAGNHLAHSPLADNHTLVSAVQEALSERNQLLKQQQAFNHELNEGRKLLKEALVTLHQQLVTKGSELATRFSRIISHGLLKSNEKNEVERALGELGMADTPDAKNVLQRIEKNHDLKRSINAIGPQLKIINTKIEQHLQDVVKSDPEKSEPSFIKSILKIIEMDERTFRLQQVRDHIAAEILAPLSEINKRSGGLQHQDRDDSPAC